MPWSALPEHINSPEEWNGKDDDQSFLTRWRKSVKGWFAYGPRAAEWWARWREFPITVLAVFGKGDSRWENDVFSVRSLDTPVVFFRPTSFYLSRVQYWCSWSFQIQWPLFVAFHWYYKSNKVLFIYFGAKRDADKVYWFPAIYIGLKWK